MLTILPEFFSTDAFTLWDVHKICRLYLVKKILSGRRGSKSANSETTLMPFYYKTGMTGRIGSTSYVLPIGLSYCTLNRVIRVLKWQIFSGISTEQSDKIRNS